MLNVFRDFIIWEYFYVLNEVSSLIGGNDFLGVVFYLLREIEVGYGYMLFSYEC